MRVTLPPAQNVVGPLAVTALDGGTQAPMVRAGLNSEVPSLMELQVPSVKLVAVATIVSPIASEVPGKVIVPPAMLLPRKHCVPRDVAPWPAAALKSSTRRLPVSDTDDEATLRCTVGV